MTDAGARLQHDAGETADGDLNAHAVLVDEHEGTVEHVQLAVLQKDDAGAVFHRDRLQGVADRAAENLAGPCPRRRDKAALEWPCPVSLYCFHRCRPAIIRACGWVRRRDASCIRQAFNHFLQERTVGHAGCTLDYDAGCPGTLQGIYLTMFGLIGRGDTGVPDQICR